jgi:hypothetical protein
MSRYSRWQDTIVTVQISSLAPVYSNLTSLAMSRDLFHTAARSQQLTAAARVHFTLALLHKATILNHTQ